MQHSSISRLVVVGLSLAIASAACTSTPGGSGGGGASGTTSTPGGSGGGGASGTLSVYSALNESTNNAFVEAFQKAYPNIKVEVLPVAAAGELQTRISSEKGAPKADVFIGGSSEFHQTLASQGLLVAYKSPNAKDIDPKYKDPDGYWTGWYLGILGIALNKDRWAAEMGAKPKPKTWDDLLDPALKGKVVMPDPVTTGAGYIFLAAQVFRFGRDEQKALDFMKQLDANVGQYLSSSPQVPQFVGQGQFLLGVNWGHDILTEANKGAPIEFIAPENAATELGAISIVKGGPNTEAAKAFVDWVLTKEASVLSVKLSNRLSLRADVPPAPGAPTLDQVNVVDYDRVWATANKDRLIKAWQKAVGK